MTTRAATPGFIALLAALTMLSPFATDTYVPALNAMRESLNTGTVQAQQTLSAYMLFYALAGITAFSLQILMIAPAVFSVIWHLGNAPNVVASIGPLLIATTGVAMATPVTQILIMEFMPARRGLAASCQAFFQLLACAVTLGLIFIALSASTLKLALGHLGWALLSLGGWLAYLAIQRHEPRTNR